MQRILLNRSHRLLGAAVAIAGLGSGLFSCSQYSTKPLSKGYHNLTAHYNAYIIARDKVAEAERTLYKSREENYNQLLPILLPVDSLVSQPVKPLLDDAIRKASLVAERHQNSKWLDNAYNLIGKARLYKQELPSAIETFKYVNTKGTDANDKHQALVGLMRAYVETGDYANGLNVAEYLRTQPLNKANTRDYYLTKAYLHQRKGEYAVAAAILDATFPILKKEEPTARLHLIAGQLYDAARQPAKAAEHYALVQRNRPTYEQSFYATIYSMQSSGLSGDAKRAAQVTGSFNRMLNDRKNTDLRDKIYYTMGLLDARSGRYDSAIDNLKRSVQATTTNTAQVPYTYLELGRLYFENKRDYPKAKAYYDSALAVLPQQSPEFAKLTKRKLVLDEFVASYTTLQREDSLQRLAQMNPAALDRLLDEQISQALKAEEAQAELARQVTGQSGGNIAGATNSNLQPNERWYLYNPISLAQGRQEFAQRWGNRPLEDNWRRTNKEASEAVAGESNPLNGTSVANAVNPAAPLTTAGSAPTGSTDPAALARKARKDAMYAQIPLTKEAQQQSNLRLETAYYKVGKLYKFSFEQPVESIRTFEQMLNRFPNTGYKPEIYYLLHLSNEQLGRPSGWKDRLLTEFSGTSYARTLSRTAVPTGSEAQAQQTYADLFALYKSGNATEALARAEAALSTFSGSQIEDKLALLRVILIGKVQGTDAYRSALSEFIRDYPGSPLVSHVKELQAAADQPTAKRK